VQRVLDIDLDFFVDGAAHWRPYDADRLDGADFLPWSESAALEFLRKRCLLTTRSPGAVVDCHGEMFVQWRKAIECGILRVPFSVTHLDAHADLGLGDSGYVHLLFDLMHRPVADRHHPQTGSSGIDDGNWLSFAVACQWIGDLTYVFNTDQPDPDDILSLVMADFDPRSRYIEIPAIAGTDAIGLSMSAHPERFVVRRDPKVPFVAVPHERFMATQPFDFICLTRSPAFTPAESDELFQEIRDLFIDEIAISGL